MRIDYCLILAAGFGTRMGAIGKSLPKVLWPVFEKTLLELQVGYARSLGISNIFINLHYMGAEIENFCKKNPAFEGVNFLWERPEILDIGGAIHNLAAQPGIDYNGKLLLLNADQFFYISKDDLMKILLPFDKNPVAIFSYWVNSSLGYNSLSIDRSRLMKGIVKNSDLQPDQQVETYTGIALIDLGLLKKQTGPSNFYESVCLFNKIDIPVILLENIDYWDFGTLKRYWESCFRILQTYKTYSNHPFLRFLVHERALKTWKIDLQNQSYHAKSPRVINLNASEEVKELGPSIILNGAKALKSTRPGIWWNDQFEEFN